MIYLEGIVSVLHMSTVTLEEKLVLKTKSGKVEKMWKSGGALRFGGPLLTDFLAKS